MNDLTQISSLLQQAITLQEGLMSGSGGPDADEELLNLLQAALAAVEEHQASMGTGGPEGDPLAQSLLDRQLFQRTGYPAQPLPMGDMGSMGY